MVYPFWGVILYGLIHAVVFAALPFLEGSAFLYVFYALLAIGVMLLVTIGGMTVLGTFILSCTPDRITYGVKVFGKTTHEQSMEGASIAVVKNSVGMGDESIQVLSEGGLVRIRRLVEMMRRGGPKITDISIVGEVAMFKSEYINIPAASLTLAERFFIEDMITRSMPVSP